MTQSWILVYLEPERRLYQLHADGRVYLQRTRRVFKEFGPHRRRELVRDAYYVPVTSARLAQRVREARADWVNQESITKGKP